MGRGAQAQTRRQIDQQLASQTAINQQLYNQNQQLGHQLAAGYQNQLANPGYTPEQQTAIRNQSMGSLSSAFAALAQNAANRTARTRNSAGYGDLLAELSREQGRQAGSLAQQNQMAFADRARNDQLAALQGLSGLYGVDNSLLARTMGVPSNLLAVREQSSRGGSGFFSSLGSSIGQGLGYGVGRLPFLLF
jgi:predicted alpha/beta hydrolase